MTIVQSRLQEIKLKIREDHTSVSMGAPRYSRADMRDDLELLIAATELGIKAVNELVGLPTELTREAYADVVRERMDNLFKETV